MEEPWWNKPKDGIETIDLPTNTNNLTYTSASESLPRLFQVEYPGFVQNPGNALRTLGGIHKVSQILSNPRKKLELRFRPGDIYCKPAYAEPNVTCGLLIKLRRRKPTLNDVLKSPDRDPSILIELSHLPDSSQHEKDKPEDSSTSLLSNTAGSQYRVIETSDKQHMIVFDGPLPPSLRENMDQQLKQNKNPESKTRHFEEGFRILEEEQKFLEQLTLKKRFQRCIDGEGHFSKDVSMGFKNRIYLKVPHNLSDIRARRSNFEIEVLGIIPRNYKFNGMCDFQYLPMKKTKKRHVSIVNKIIPAFGNPDVPDATLDDLIVCRLGNEGRDKNIPSFLVPNILSRVDKPLDDLGSFLEGGLAKDIVYNHQPHTLSTTRAKRVIYSHLCNFRASDHLINSSDTLVPSAPMPEATNDAAKRGLLGSHLDLVKNLFQKRPVYTKIQVENECGVGLFSLKYLLPVVAYFALNGPWRSCWIRYGYDPRKDKFAFAYQLLDYRVPNAYRSLMERKRNTTVEVERECLYTYQPDTIPPKCQMIYQVCEIRIKEIDELIKVLEERMREKENPKFDTRFGFLNEDIVEYCRYCISRNIELYLFSQGRIQGVTLPEVTFPAPGDVETELPFRSNATKVSQSHTRRPVGEKRKLRPRAKAYPCQDPLTEADEASNQSTNVVDLKIRDHFSHDKETESDSEDDEDDDQRIIQEALDATTCADGQFTEEEEDGDEEDIEDEEEMNPEDIDPDQILGLE